jgi:hypothetical protein
MSLSVPYGRAVAQVCRSGCEEELDVAKVQSCSHHLSMFFYSLFCFFIFRLR